jgi:CRISPR-associated protein Csb3
MMQDLAANISLPVDYSNPGQFFACCGCLELADKIWDGTEGWFEVDGLEPRFQIAAGPVASLEALLNFAKHIWFELKAAGKDGDKEAASVDPIFANLPIPTVGPAFTFVLDWWSEKSMKPWGGLMKERRILNATLRAIDPRKPDTFNDDKVAYDPETGKKCEPFYFDCRRSAIAHSLDSGFSPDEQELESKCFPAVEALCFIGLQRARPAPTGRPNQLRYVVWTEPLPVNALAPVVCGLVPMQRSLSLIFDNFSRTDRGELKGFARATCERNRNVPGSKEP